MNDKLSVQQVVDAIERLNANERMELLTTLPAVLKLTIEDYGWLKTAESSFEFWDNEDDAIYDRL